jgi:transposase InsO family protein
MDIRAGLERCALQRRQSCPGKSRRQLARRRLSPAPPTAAAARPQAARHPKGLDPARLGARLLQQAHSSAGRRATTCRLELVADALEIALVSRGRQLGSFHHSDEGSQYVSLARQPPRARRAQQGLPEGNLPVDPLRGTCYPDGKSASCSIRRRSTRRPLGTRTSS